MPGSIHVTVLEAVELPAKLKESLELVAVKVSLGSQESITRYKRLEEGKSAPWDSDFAFPVLNLTNNLGVAVCDPEGKILTNCEIGVRSIVEQGYREEFVELSEGGRLHLKLSFVLTDEERKKVDQMRAAAQRKKEKEQKDDAMRAYDFKRKEDYCTDNGLRTISESEVEHAGKSLDNWEVFSKKKEKEVSPANHFPLPQTQQPPTLKPQPSCVEIQKPFQFSQDRERCSKNKYSSSGSSVEGVLCHSSLNQENVVEAMVRTSSPEPTLTACSTANNSETQSSVENQLGTCQPKPLVIANTKDAPNVLTEMDEQKENRPTQFSSVDNKCRMGCQGDHVFCHAPEVEECMEIRQLENRQVKKETPSQEFAKPREESPILWKNVPVNASIQDCEISCNRIQHIEKEDRGTVQIFAPKENVTTLQESSSLLQGVVAAVRMSTLSEWESIRKLPRVKEVDRISAKVSVPVKDIPSDVHSGSGEIAETVPSAPDFETPKLGVDGSGERTRIVPSLKDCSPKPAVRGVGEKGNFICSSAEVGSSKMGPCPVGEKGRTFPSSPEDGSPKLGLRGIGEKGRIVSSSPEIGSPRTEVRGIAERGRTVPSSPEVGSPKMGAYQLETKSKLSSSLGSDSPRLGARRIPETARHISSPLAADSENVGGHAIDEKTRMLSSSPEIGSPRVEAYQLEPKLKALSCYDSESPRLSNSGAKVEKSPGLLSRLLSDDSSSPETESSIFSSTAPLPMDGWVCVERPPMTWEDALRVAQRAREAALGVQQQSTSPLPLPSLAKLPTYSFAGPPSPVTPRGVPNVPFSYTLPSPQDVTCSPLPRPPKSSPSKASTTGGYVKAHVDTFETRSNQASRQVAGSFGDTLLQTETSSPLVVQMESVERSSREEELIKWEERLRNWGQSAEVKVIQEESRHRNHATERSSWDMDDFEDSIRKDFEARLQSPSSDCESTSSRLGVSAAEVRWDVGDGTKSRWQGEDTEATTSTECGLELLGDFNVEDLEESLMEEVRKTEENVHGSVSGRVLSSEEGTKNVKDQTLIKTCEGPDKETVLDEKRDDSSTENLVKGVRMEIVAAEKESPATPKRCDVLIDPVANKACDTGQKFPAKKTLSKLRAPSPFSKHLLTSGESQWSLKSLKSSKAKPRLPCLVSNFISDDMYEPFRASEAWITKAMIDHRPGMKKADLIIESLCKSLEPGADFLSPSESTSESSVQGEESEPLIQEEDKPKTSLLRGALKQVLGGAVLVAGVLVFWPKNAGNTERYHVVKTGETLSNILPGQSTDPSSRFCEFNPQVCERKTIYPGQRLRLA